MKIKGGEFLTYVDSDDYLALDIYEKCINRFNASPSMDMIIFSFVNEPKNYHIKKESICLDIDRLKNDEAISLYETMIITPSVWNKIYRWDTIKSIKFTNGRFYEDVAYTYLTLYSSKYISTISDIGYYYRVDNMNSTSIVIKDNILDLFLDLENLRQHFVDINENKYVASVNTLLIFHMRSVLNESKKLSIYKEYLSILRKTNKYPIRVKSRSNYYIRYRLFSYSPDFALKVQKIIDKMYNLIVPKLRSFYKK